MKLSKNICALLITASLATGFATQQAKAVQISGSIDFAGTAHFNAPLTTATQVVDFANTHVEFATGDFATFTSTNDPVAITAPYVFNPSTSYSPLWSVGGFVFNLAQSTIITQTQSGLLITGTGTLMGNGFDDTPGAWAISSQNPGQSSRSTFAFSAGIDALPSQVPDGGSSVALLGVGLMMLEGLRRRAGAV